MNYANYFLEKADQCGTLARYAAQACGADSEVARALRALSDEFTAKAVEAETIRQRRHKA